PGGAGRAGRGRDPRRRSARRAVAHGGRRQLHPAAARDARRAHRRGRLGAAAAAPPARARRDWIVAMDLRHRRLRLSRFAIRPPGAAAGVMMHSRLQSVVDVGADGLDLLRRFASPTAPSALADLVAGDVDALLAVIAELVAAGILVGEDEEEDLRRGGRAGWEAQQALLVAADAPLFGGGIDAAE